MKRLFYLCLLMLFTTSWLVAQQTVTGTVSAEDGLPLIGVSIQEKGTSNGTISDIDGKYSLTVQNGATITYSYTGYETKEMLASSNPINISLSPGVVLDEAVITALGIKRSEKALSYSATTVDDGNLEVARETNIANSLAGKVAGVNINRTSTGAGGSSRIVIRGNSSISGNNQPLIVVDGVPLDNTNLGSAGMWGGSDGGDGISSVNPSDVESMTVLKGNTAGALYGYRASNGVILITTKSGKAGKGIGVDVNSSFQADNLINTFDFQNQYGHGDRGVAPGNEAEALANGLYAWGGRLDGSSVLQFDGESRPYSDTGNNLSRFYNTGNTYTNNIAFSGGNDIITYRLSGTAMNNSDIVPNSGLSRYTLNLNTNAKINERLSVNVAGSYVDEQSKNRPRLSDSPGNANYTVLSLPASINVESLQGDENKLGANADGEEYQFNDNVFVTNPYWSSHQFENNASKNRITGNTTLTYQLIDGLSVRGRLSMDRYDRRRRDLTPYGTAFSPFGGLTETNLKFQEINRELLFIYDKAINDNISLNLIAGGNQQVNQIEDLGAGGGNFSIPFLHDIRNIRDIDRRYDFSAFGVNSLFGQAEIGLMNNLYVNGSIRTDWFSSLTKPEGQDSDNAKTYYGVGASWVFTDAFALPAAIDYGKLRVGFAQVGGATDPYQLSLQYGVFGAFNGQPLGGISSANIPNSGLVPSTSNEFEIGADFRFMKDRLGLDLAYYNRSTTNDILFAAASQASGYSQIVVNVGEITNRGVELLLNVVPVRSSKFEWSSSFNFARNNNQVVSLLTPEADGENVRVDQSRTLNAFITQVEGLPYSQVSGFRYMRNDGGDIMYDENNLPLRDETVHHFGTGVHPNTFGFSNTFKFGNFSVSALIDARTGGYLYTATNSFAYLRGLHQNTLVGREDGNVGPVTLSESANVQDYYQRIAGISEEFISESNYAKLREVILTYSLPASMLGTAPIKGVNISLTGRNLALLYSSVANVDPESTYNNGNAQGLEMFGVPQTRSIGVNLNLKF